VRWRGVRFLVWTLQDPEAAAACRGVMKIVKLRTTNPATYYVEIIASGAEEYYLRSPEAHGRWTGAGTALLGLDGEVDADDLRAILAHRDPTTGTRLTSQRVTLPGFDVTFSAPKSVSLIWALGNSDAQQAVVAAHDKAVAEALGYLERHGCRVRRGRGGVFRVRGRGLVAAAFRHTTSRDGDPQLHTHVLVANMAQGLDGKWSALDGQAFLRHPKAAGCVYQAVLRRELVGRLGVRFELHANGTAEVTGIDAPVRRAFSKRRVAIVTQLAAWGATGTAAAQAATLATRAPKDRVVSFADLARHWHEEAASIGFSLANVPCPGVPHPLVPDFPDDAAIGALVTEDRATFEWEHVVMAAASSCALGATAAEVEARAAVFLTGPLAVPVIEGERWTTTEILDLEAQALAQAAKGWPTAGTWVNAGRVSDVLRARPHLSEEQVAMVRDLAGTFQPVSVVVGYPGSGKTAALEAARTAWETEGRTAIGVCLAARTARGLEADSGIRSTTLDGLFVAQRQGRLRLHDHCVVVLDEAAMVGTRKLAALIDLCARAHARLVLVGDPRQLPAIGPGGLFAALAKRLGSSTLTSNLRQRRPLDRRVVAELRQGRVSEAVDRLHRAGRVTTAPTPEELHAAMVEDWLAASKTGTAVMITLTLAAAHRLHDVARQRLQALGRVGDTIVTLDGTDFALGDQVMCLRNARRLGVVNGDVATVTGGDDQGLHVALRSHAVVLPYQYLADGHLTHAYAVTAHKAQGLTCDTALLLGDEHLFAEAGYVALSRGRQENRIYTLATETDHEHLPPLERDPITAIKVRMARHVAERTATEQIARRR
jgi:conjugative relaxase-like TrwC/TraI family protein